MPRMYPAAAWQRTIPAFMYYQVRAGRLASAAAVADAIEALGVEMDEEHVHTHYVRTRAEVEALAQQVWDEAQAAA